MLDVRSSVTAVLLSAILVGCSGGDGPADPGGSGGPPTPPPPPPGITLLTPRTINDTVQALIPAGLSVIVRDAQGVPMVGADVKVRVDGIPINVAAVAMLPLPWNFVGLSDGTKTSSMMGTETTFTTASDGSLTLRVRLNQYARSTWIWLEVPAGGYRDSVAVVIRPGVTAGVRAFPEDTAVHVGAAFTPAGVAVDRVGNPTMSPVEHTGLGDAAISVSGGAVRGNAFGRGRWVVRSGEFADTAWVSAVPAGTLAAVRAGDSIRLTTMQLDGSERRAVRTSWWRNKPVSLAWTPDGDSLAFAAEVVADSITLVQIPFTGGEMRRLLPVSPVRRAYAMQYLLDGSGFFFVGHSSIRSELHVAKRDGSDARIIESISGHVDVGTPAPSPDGRYVAYALRTLRVHDRETDTVRTFPFPAVHVQWSPDGQWIAFPSNTGLHLVRPDGTEQRIVAGLGSASTPDLRFGGAVTWSPDSRYVVVPEATTTMLMMVDVASGMAVPLPYSTEMGLPAWRPTR